MPLEMEAKIGNLKWGTNGVTWAGFGGQGRGADRPDPSQNRPGDSDTGFMARQVGP